LATAPIGAAHFNTVAHYGLIANLLSVPLMGLIIIPSAVLAAVAFTAWFATASAEGISILAALWETVKVPSQLIQSLPYLFVVIVLAGFVGKAIPPRAGGQPYVKER
jgi:ABC-type uncharacterized transport system permease subunit